MAAWAVKRGFDDDDDDDDDTSCRSLELGVNFSMIGV